MYRTSPNQITGLLAAVLAASATLAVSEALAAEPDFAHDVVPILKKHCAECHTGRKSEGQFSFTTKRLLLESGHVVPAKSTKSRLVELISSVDPEDQMPPADRARVSPAEIDVLNRWIDGGLKWEDGYRFSAASYEPPLLPRAVELPPVVSSHNAVDRLLHPYFKRHQLNPPAPVSDRVFLRRVYMDLIGLPPTLEEQQEFLTTQSPQRRQELIDALLARDHDYAEHWISFWNDLLRNDYAGTGYIDGGRRQISDWLYRSLATNKPYDIFVRELIAPTPASDGFINGIKWRGNVNASQVREVQFAQSVTQVFLGINMKCASCHDSFIDRWTLDEAYGLAAVYSNRELEIHRCDKPTGRVAKAAWIFPKLGSIDPASPQPERLKQLAALMTSKQNGRFARTIVNRLWHRLLGRGIVHPVDAMHTEPWHPDLLDYLANEHVASGYDLRSTLALIAKSKAYQGIPASAQDWATSEEFVFHGPAPRHITAEQFMDSIWRLTGTPPAAIQAPIPEDAYYGRQLTPATANGKWIWSYADAGGAPAGEEASFLKRFSLAEIPARAVLVITCDNAYTAWVNGKKVGADAEWGTVESRSVVRVLKTGENELVITGRNAGNSPNAAGLYAEIVFSGEAPLKIATDETWQAINGPINPSATQKTEWRAAAAVTRQDFLGPDIAKRIAVQLTSAASSQQRTPRASLMKSNMLMRSLGRPNREQIVTTRPASLSTLQAIDLANGAFLNDLLGKGARNRISQLESPELFIKNLFREAVCREPSVDERRLAMSLLSDTPSAETVQDLLWLLIMLPEFQFVQ